MQLSAQQVEAMAADRGAVSKAKALAEPAHWQALGRSERAIWGECKGSAVYQVRVDLRDLVATCSCPSRQSPCKHGLGLLFLAVLRERAFTAVAADADAPEWVHAWLTRRDAASKAKASAKEEAKATRRPVDAAARVKRAAARESDALAGIDTLERWLADLVRVGLAGVELRSPGIFEEEARRLVDAKAGALASWVRRLGTIPLSTPTWPAELLAQLGRLALLCRAYRRLAALDPALQIDVRQLVGFALSQAEVVAHGDHVADRWQVIAQVVSDDDKLRSQRTWLMGQVSGRRALILQFAPGPRGRFAELLLPGTVIEATLAFYPGAAPQRALLLEREGAPAPIEGALWGAEGLAAFMDARAQALARQPWIERFAGVLEQVAVHGGDGQLWVIDRAGLGAPVRTRDPFLLLAVSGGHPIDLAGEWEGAAFSPHGALVDGRYLAVQPSLFEAPAADGA